MSLLFTASVALAMMCRLDSHTPIGSTPGHLSRAIRQLAIRASNGLGLTISLDILLAVLARALQRSVEAPLKEQHMWRITAASISERP